MNHNPGIYNIQTYTAAVSASVAAAIAAPGSGKSIVVVGVGYSVTNGADDVVTVKDANTSAVHILKFATDDEGHGAYYPMNVRCTANKAVTIDFGTGGTAEANVVINYYVDKLGN